METAPRRSGWWLKGGCCFGALVVVGVGYGIYLCFHPYDRVDIEVRDVPADTVFVCLVADRSGRPDLMHWSLEKVFPFTMHPDKCIVSERLGSEVGPLRASVRWVSSERVGVLLKATSGRWRIAWFSAADSRVQDRSLVFGGGSWRASLRDAVSEQQFDEGALRAVGLDYALKNEK